MPRSPNAARYAACDARYGPNRCRLRPRGLGLAAAYLFGALLLVSCLNLKAIPEDHPCREAAYAIAARTEECTGDPALANERFEAFEKTYVCIAVDVMNEHEAIETEDLYHCAYTIRELPCELVEAYGDELDRYLATSDACTWIVARRDGHALPDGPG